MLYKVLENTGVALVMIGAMAVEGNPWYIPVAFIAAGSLLVAWGAWEEGIWQRRRSERRYHR